MKPDVEKVATAAIKEAVEGIEPLSIVEIAYELGLLDMTEADLKAVFDAVQEVARGLRN